MCQLTIWLREYILNPETPDFATGLNILYAINADPRITFNLSFLYLNVVKRNVVLVVD